MSADTYYTVLGVPETATQTDIKTAYHNLIKQVHPDTLPQTSPYWRKIAEDKAKELTEAYTVLSDAKQRATYDRLLSSHRQQSAPPRPPEPPHSYAPPRQSNPSPQKFNVQRKSNSGWAWLGVFGVIAIIGLLSYSDRDTHIKNTSAAASIPISSSVPASLYSAYPCERGQTTSPIDGKQCKDDKDTAPVDFVPYVPPKSKPRPAKQAPKPLVTYATVTGTYASIDKRCAFLPIDNYGRCGYGPETIARLQKGDRVRLLSPKVRAENGEDIYKVRTQQGWEGWIKSADIAIEEQ
jgi:hypothetical protein